MRNPVHKCTYKGHGIYWHGVTSGYGDETIASFKSVAAMKIAIDEQLAAAEQSKPAHLKYWDSLSHDERARWRRLSQTTELSASELAYTNS